MEAERLTMRYALLCLALAGCANSSADDKAIERYRSRVVERGTLPPQLETATLENVHDVAARVGELESRMDAAEASLAILSLTPDPVPQAEPEPTPAPPKAEIVEAPDQKAVFQSRTVRIKGKSEDADAVIKRWYRGMWTHRVSEAPNAPTEEITHHLIEDHGIPAADLAGLDNATKEKLHSALHERDEATFTYAASSISVESCPNGKCPVDRPAKAKRDAKRALKGKGPR